MSPHQQSRHAAGGAQPPPLREELDVTGADVGSNNPAAEYSAQRYEEPSCLRACARIRLLQLDDHSDVVKKCSLTDSSMEDAIGRQCGLKNVKQEFKLVLLDGRSRCSAVHQLNGEGGQKLTERPLRIT